MENWKKSSKRLRKRGDKVMEGSRSKIGIRVNKQIHRQVKREALTRVRPDGSEISLEDAYEEALKLWMAIPQTLYSDVLATGVKLEDAGLQALKGWSLQRSGGAEDKATTRKIHKKPDESTIEKDNSTVTIGLRDKGTSEVTPDIQEIVSILSRVESLLLRLEGSIGVQRSDSAADEFRSASARHSAEHVSAVESQGLLREAAEAHAENERAHRDAGARPDPRKRKPKTG
jgi:hypothetical protein